MGYSPWGHKELDMTKRPSTAQHTVVPHDPEILCIKKK